MKFGDFCPTVSLLLKMIEETYSNLTDGNIKRRLSNIQTKIKKNIAVNNEYESCASDMGNSPGPIECSKNLAKKEYFRHLSLFEGDDIL